MSRAGTLVLLYHRVARLACDPHGLAVRPDRFAEHCEILRRHCEVVSLRQGNRSRRQVAITFDDGYADNAGEARDILSAAGLPATFFVTVGPMGQQREAWWDRLAGILLEANATAEAVETEIAGRCLWSDFRSTAARHRAHLALFWRLRPLHPTVIDSVIARLETKLAIPRVDRDDYRWMTADELRSLAATPGVDVGAHTITHPFLASLNPDEQWREIQGSRQSLEELLNSSVTLFSYPYGGPDAMGAVTTELVRKAGYVLACTASGGIARPDADPLKLPRNVVGDWEAARFEAWLNEWLTQP